MDFGALLILAFLGWIGWLFLRPRPKSGSEKAAPILTGDGSYGLSAAGVDHHAEPLSQIFASAIRDGRDSGLDEDAADPMDDGESDLHEAVAELRLDDQNKFDANAVEVLIAGQLVGYLPAKLAPYFRAYIKRAGLAGKVFRCRAKVDVPLSRGAAWSVLLDLPRLKR